MVPAVISPFVIDRIGKSNAYRYFLTGEKFSSSEALTMGLLHEVVDGETALDERVDKIANEIVSNSPEAVKACKNLIQKVSVMSNYFDAETRSFLADEIAGIRVSEEGQEGLTSFFEKRKPSWTTTKK